MNPIISALAGAAIYGSAPVARTFKSRETRYARDESIWREELAEMSGAQLVNLNSMVHGFTAPGVRRAHGFQPTHSRLAGVTGGCARSQPLRPDAAAAALS